MFLASDVKNGVTLRDVIERCERTFNGASSADYVHPGLRDAVLSVMPTNQRHKPTLEGLGYWMRGQKDRRVGGMWFNKKPSTGHSPTIWWWRIRKVANPSGPHGVEERREILMAY